MKVFFHFYLWFFALSLSAQSFESGKIIDSVLIPETTSENFTLYLPTSYDATSLSSIVFIFDPGGNGINGVTPFIKASEAYGHILICSNDIRNGPYDRNFDLTQRLFDYSFSIFNIEEKLIYLAGFSGGSRLASSLATLTDSFAGVIGCGAGFSSIPSLVPSTQDFSYVGICGNRDMNYTEMVGVKGYLDSKNFNNIFFTYDGGHSWPPQEQILKAFDWLSFQAHKKGVKELDEAQINNIYSLRYQEANNLKNNNNLLDAVEAYEQILSTYKSSFVIDSVQKRVDDVRKTKAYKQSLKSVVEAFKKENEVSRFFVERFSADVIGEGKVNIKWWEKELAKLNALSKKGNPETEKMIARIKSKMSILAYTNSNEKQKPFCDALLKLIYPEYYSN